MNESNVDKRFNAFQAAFAKQLRDQGKSLQYIAKVFGTNMKHVKEMLKEAQ